MAAVSINYGLTSGDPFTDVDPSDWPSIIAMQRRFCTQSVPHDCRLLLRFIENARAVEFAGYDDEDAYIREGLGLDPQAVTWAVEGLKLTGAEVPVRFADAIERGRRAAADVMAISQPQITRSKAMEGNSNAAKRQNSDDDIITVSKRKALGTSAAYLAARLKRDAPDIAAAVERGEFRSIRAAALAAGIVRQKTPIEHLRAWWRKASEDERTEFRAEIETV